MEQLFLLVVVLAIAVGALVAASMRARRQREMAAVAAANGLSYSFDDPFGLPALPFGLFRRGDGRGADNVMWGPAGESDDGDVAVRAFDYWYYEEQRDSEGRTSRRYKKYSCVTAETGAAAWPHLEIDREGMLQRVMDAVGLDDIQFESDEFNRSFEVRCEDARFASALVDPRMMEWLLGTEGRCRFEVHGAWLLVAIERVPPASVPALMNLALTFREKIPAVVRSLYPT